MGAGASAPNGKEEKKTIDANSTEEPTKDTPSAGGGLQSKIGGKKRKTKNTKKNKRKSRKLRKKSKKSN